jgi:ABC-type sugar transport system substrate-binding protein
MFKKSIKIFILTLLIFVFAFGTVVLAAQKTESVTAAQSLPVPRVVTNRPLVLGFQTNTLMPESAQRIYLHIQIEAKHRGWKLVSNLDTATEDLQRAGLENFINQDVDAIVFFTGTPETWTDIIIKAREKGIGFYSIDTGLRDGIIVNTTQSNGVAGAKMIHYGVDRLKERGNVLVINYPVAVVYRQRGAVAKGLLETEWPNIKMVGYEFMSPEAMNKSCFEITQNYLTKYDNDIQWVFNIADSMGFASARAAEEAGLTREDLFVTGIDGGTQAYAEIRNGTPFTATLSQPFELYTHNVCEVINQIQIEGIAPGEPDSMVPASRTIYSEGVVTTPENVPSVGTVIHELFRDSYYDPNNKDAWYFWGEPYKVE